MNVECTLQHLTVTSALSKSDKIDWAIVWVNATSSTMRELPELSVWPVSNPDTPFKRYDRLIETYHPDLSFHSGFCVSRDGTPVTVKA